MNETTGRKEIAENVVQAVFIAVATGLVGLGFQALQDAIEKRKQKDLTNAA